MSTLPIPLPCLWSSRTLTLRGQFAVVGGTWVNLRHTCIYIYHVVQVPSLCKTSENTLLLVGRVSGQVRLYGERGRGGGGADRDEYQDDQGVSRAQNILLLIPVGMTRRIEDFKTIGGASSPTPLNPHLSQVPPAAQVGGANPQTSGVRARGAGSPTDHRPTQNALLGLGYDRTTSMETEWGGWIWNGALAAFRRSTGPGPGGTDEERASRETTKILSRW